MKQPNKLLQDACRNRIVDFFNEDWLGHKKERVCINITADFDDLIEEYDRTFGIKLSRAQIAGFLVKKELKKSVIRPNYQGEYMKSNLTKIKEKFKPKKISNAPAKKYDPDDPEMWDQEPEFDFTDYFEVWEMEEGYDGVKEDTLGM